jgi:hypothetical protein
MQSKYCVKHSVFQVLGFHFLRFWFLVFYFSVFYFLDFNFGILFFGILLFGISEVSRIRNLRRIIERRPGV